MSFSIFAISVMSFTSSSLGGVPVLMRLSSVHVSGLVMWDEEGVQDHALRPKEVTLELVYYYPEEYMKENGMDSADIQVLDTKVVKVTSDNCQPFDFGWREHITSSGELKFYAVREKPIDNYKTTMNYNGYSVLNSVLNTPVRDVSVTIELDKQIVNLLEGIELPNQQTFQFELLKPQDDGNAARVSNVTLTGEGHVQFPPLALTDVGTYTYLVREYSDDAPGWVFDHTGYPVKVTVSDVNGQLQATADVIPTITNIFETTILNVGVKVKWVDNNTEKKPIPRYVQVELFADGKSAGQAHPSQKSNWMASFAEMPEYRRANTARAVQMVPVVYTLTADEVEDFTVCITGDAKSGYVVIYSAIPDIPETGDRMNLPLVAGMLLMSMSMLIVLVHKRKRN